MKSSLSQIVLGLTFWISRHASAAITMIPTDTINSASHASVPNFNQASDMIEIPQSTSQFNEDLQYGTLLARNNQINIQNQVYENPHWQIMPKGRKMLSDPCNDCSIAPDLQQDDSHVSVSDVLELIPAVFAPLIACAVAGYGVFWGSREIVKCKRRREEQKFANDQAREIESQNQQNEATGGGQADVQIQIENQEHPPSAKDDSKINV